MNFTRIYAAGRQVGQVTNGIFSKTVLGSRHFLRFPKAICLSETSLYDAEAAGAVSIRVTDQETGLIYTSTLTHFKRYSFDLQRGKNEPQKALTLDYWSISGGNAVNVTPQRATQPQPPTAPAEAWQDRLFK